jgi:hypothetical protein
MDAFISRIADALMSFFAMLWGPVAVAGFLVFVVYALWPSNWQKFFPAKPTSVEGSPADRSSTP